MAIEAKFNGKQRTGSKSRVFVCRLTDGRIAIMVEGDESVPTFAKSIDEVKQTVGLRVPEIRIAMYDEHELPQIGRSLGESSVPAA